MIDSTGLLLIGSFCLAYSLFYRKFAEFHVDLAIFDFPIFLGEILLFICLLIFFIKVSLKPAKVSKFGYLLILYFLFVILKAGLGYSEFGPLAFRHAALFYYSMFAIFGYYFFSRSFFNKKMSLFLALFIILLSKIYPPYEYYLAAYFALAVIFIKTQPSKGMKYVLFFLLLFTFPFKSFFMVSRMMLISNIVAILFVVAILITRSKIKTIFKIALGSIILLGILTASLKMTDRNAIISMINFKKIVTLYQENDKIVVDKEGDYLMENLKTRLYNPDHAAVYRIKKDKLAQTNSINQLSTSQIIPEPQIKVRPKILTMQEPTIKPQIKSESSSNFIPKVNTIQPNSVNLISQPQQQYRDLNNAYYNGLFRIFIWRDTWKQMAENIHIFGFAFGKPFRSKSIEILEWAKVEWKRDGWVAMHNSYLDIIYRAGIIGIGLIIILFTILYRLIRKSYCEGSFYGIIVSGVIINWLVASNFLEILELPYTAIPFWSLFGMLYAYLFKPIKSDTLK